MKKLLSFILLINVLHTYSQDFILSPAAWYRADHVNQNDTLWFNQIGNEYHAWPQQEIFPDTALLNYNKCFSFNGQTPAFTVPLSSFSYKAAVLIAYQTDDTLSERGLWAFATDSTRIGISTQRIFNERIIIRYSDTNRTDAIVNTINPSWKIDKFNPDKLYIGGTDSIPFKGKLGEVVVFDRFISGKELLQWQSYLSVKHGITLEKLNYLDSQGDTTWHYNQHPAYHAAISGLGRDTLFGLHQKQSVMDNRLTISIGKIAVSNALNSSVIPEGNFLIWGIDSNRFYFPRTTYLQNGEELLTYGNCLMEVTGNTIRTLPTSLQIDVSKWQDVEPLHCVLLIDRDHTGDFSGNSVEIYTPTYFDTTGIITFSGIYWDTDHSGSDLFRIGFIPNDTAQITIKSLVSTNTGNSKTSDEANNSLTPLSNTYQLYPNPTRGNYNLDINLTEVSDIIIHIVSPEGKIIDVWEDKGAGNYHFTGNISTKGCYIIEIKSHLESKSIKLIKN